MKIKYGMLPPIALCQKIITVSFNTPQKNLAVYKFATACSKHLAYIENERIKLFQKYGTPDDKNSDVYYIPPNSKRFEDFKKSFEEICNMQIEEDIPELPLTEEDFENENCEYSPNKKDWLNGAEISTILGFCKE